MRKLQSLTFLKNPFYFQIDYIKLTCQYKLDNYIATASVTQTQMYART